MAIGDIGSASDPVIFDAVQGIQTSFAYRGDNIGVVAFKGPDNDGKVKAFAVSDAGVLGEVFAGSLVIPAGSFTNPKLIHVAGDIFAVVYHDTTGLHGWLKTFSVSDAGAISAVLGSLDINDDQGMDPEICHVSGDVYALTFSDRLNDPLVTTVSISGAGAVADVDREGLVLGTATAPDPSICHVAGEIFAVAYNGDSNEHRITTFGISGAGVLGAAIQSSTIFDAAGGTQFSVISDGSMVAIAYPKDIDSHGWLKTVTVDGAGNVSGVIGLFEFDDALCVQPRIVAIGESVYAIAYQGPGGGGWLKTIGITSAGIIDAGVIDFLEFEPAVGGTPSIGHIAGNVYAITFTGEGPAAAPDGRVRTVGIVSPGARLNNLMMGLL
ncbi:hypothetical protein ES707_09539 [subsurface metagenome]